MMTSSKLHAVTVSALVTVISPLATAHVGDHTVAAHLHADLAAVLLLALMAATVALAPRLLRRRSRDRRR